jgi:prolipoprotein diacylglyceryltransferase
MTFALAAVVAQRRMATALDLVGVGMLTITVAVSVILPVSVAASVEPLAADATVRHFAG